MFPCLENGCLKNGTLSTNPKDAQSPPLVSESSCVSQGFLAKGLVEKALTEIPMGFVRGQWREVCSPEVDTSAWKSCFFQCLGVSNFRQVTHPDCIVPQFP